jgi:hypothetical protein
MEQSSLSETDSRSDGLEISRVLENTMTYRVQISPQLVCKLTYFMQLTSSNVIYSKAHFNIFLPPTTKSPEITVSLKFL